MGEEGRLCLRPMDATLCPVGRGVCYNCLMMLLGFFFVVAMILMIKHYTVDFIYLIWPSHSTTGASADELTRIGLRKSKLDRKWLWALSSQSLEDLQIIS